MTDPLVGQWCNLTCLGPPEIEELLAGATLSVSDAFDVVWKIAGEPVAGEGERTDGKLRGRFIAAGVQPCYYEIAARTPPEDLAAPRRYVYGIVSFIHERHGGDLGDPGAWKAEESGQDTGS